jgi:hypothetical protein
MKRSISLLFISIAMFVSFSSVSFSEGSHPSLGPPRISSIILDGSGPEFQVSRKEAYCKYGDFDVVVEQRLEKEGKNHDAQLALKSYKFLINGKSVKGIHESVFRNHIWTGGLSVSCGSEAIVKVGFRLNKTSGPEKVPCRDEELRLLQFRIEKKRVIDFFIACDDSDQLRD